MRKLKHDIKKYPYLSSGVECRVFEYSPRVLIKAYRTKGERDRAHSRQKMACRAGIAPPTRGILKYGRKFAYLSVLAEIDDFQPPTKKVRGNAYKKLKNTVERLGLSSFDLHEGNIGRYQGKPCVIDFGDQSITDGEGFTDDSRFK